MYKTLEPVEDVLEVALGGAAAVAVGSCRTMSVAGAMLELREDEFVGRRVRPKLCLKRVVVNM
jgi:hypothetical protein